MSYRTIVRHCSPTLAGLKTGSLFSAGKESRKELVTELRKLNGILKKKGLRALIFESRCGKQLVYIYRPTLLKRDLSSDDAVSILKARTVKTKSTFLFMFLSPSCIPSGASVLKFILTSQR